MDHDQGPVPGPAVVRHRKILVSGRVEESGQAGKCLKRTSGDLAGRLLSYPGGSTFSRRSCGAGRPPGLSLGRSETNVHPRTAVDSCTTPDDDQATHVNPPFGAVTSWTFPPCCPCPHEQRPVGTHPVTDQEGAVCDRTPPPPHLCAREDTTEPNFARGLTKTTGGEEPPSKPARRTTSRRVLQNPGAENPGTKIHRLSRWKHRRAPATLG